MAHLRQRCIRALKALLILAASLSGGVAAGEMIPDAAPQETASKPAWQWKATERLSQRFNPESLRARAAELRAEERAFQKSSPAPAEEVWELAAEGSSSEGPVVDRVDGRKTPELFLPSELFDFLLSMGFPSEGRYQNKTREIVEKRAVALGFGRDLWLRLNKASAPYLKLQRENDRSRGTKPASGETRAMDEDELRWCRARSTAMAAAEAEFGEELFLRLLYLAVAPELSRTYLVTNGYDAHASFLLFVEGGCR